MGITSYTTLVSTVESWLHRSNLDAAIVPSLIALAENRIYREMRTRDMETALNSAISSGVVALPSNYLSLKHARIDGTPARPLERKTAEWIYKTYPTRAAEGKPYFIATDGGNFVFGPYPDSAYTVKGTYYARLTALSDANPTNWLITRNSDLILWATLAEAAPFVQDDERVGIWESKYQAAKAAIQYEEDKESVSGSSLRVTVG